MKLRHQDYTTLEIVIIIISLYCYVACYMNSALQCIANTKFFYEYFVKNKAFMKQMNLKSKFGHQGELAQSFAELVRFSRI